MTAAHAEYAPSSMYLTVACPGWQRQAAGRTSPPNETTLEGEAGHWVAAEAAHIDTTLSCWIGTLAPNGVEITEEMLDGGNRWVEALEGFLAKIETPVQIPTIHPTKCFGTPDARQWNPARRLLRLADYKFGHEFVDEFENWQLLAYAVGVMNEIFPYDWRNETDVTIEMTVVQPRYYNAAPIRTWAIQTAGLKHYAERMRTAVLEAESPNPRLISGTHCTHCPARVDCPTLGKTVMHAVDFTGRPDPMVTIPESVGRELALVQEFIKRLEARETGLEAVAESLLKSGQRVPFYSMQPVTGRLAWTVPLEVVEMSARQVGKSALAPPKLVTPTQAKDRKLLDTRVIEAYSDRPSGAMKLTRDTHTTARKFA